MTAVTTDLAGLAPRHRPSGGMTRLLRRLSALATAAAERLTSRYRDVPPEFYRFQPF
jgi:hypothetical protein